MERLYSLSNGITKYINISPQRLFFFISMAYWFALGGLFGVLISFAVPFEMFTCFINVGAFSSLFFGFLGSAFWLLKEA